VYALDSLRELGINTPSMTSVLSTDDWESPTLGAWGLGWEVWLDGMEVTQFTYFQGSWARWCAKPVLGGNHLWPGAPGHVLCQGV